MKRYWKVELRTEAIIEADGEDHAREIARELERDILSDTDDMEIDVVGEVTQLVQLPYPWDGECIPYGGDDDTRLKDLLP